MEQAIRVENVSKKYNLGHKAKTETSLREALTSLVLWSKHEENRKTDSNALWALNDVSFDVMQGEIVGIVGKNGAGKSTLLKILSRITKPTHGRVQLQGRVGSLLEVGTGFNPELTGRENVFLNGAILGMRRAEINQKFDEIVDFAEIDKFIDTPVKHYSSGMYMRLAFGVAAHLNPEILIVDEVLAVGDYSFQKKCIGKISNVAQQGRTVLFVSHNLLALRSLCNRVIWLDQGKMVSSGDPNDVINSYVQKDANVSHKKVWPNQGSTSSKQEIIVCSVGLCTTDGSIISRITVDDPFQIAVEYINMVTDSLLQVSLVLYNLEGVCILNTRSTPRTFPAGKINQTCTIPGHFLNDDTYTVRVVIVKDTNIGVFDESNVLSFDVHDTERSGGWFGKWIGVTRPQFDWTDSVDS